MIHGKEIALYGFVLFREHSIWALPFFYEYAGAQRMRISFNILRLTPDIYVPSEGMGGKPRAMEAKASC